MKSDKLRLDILREIFASDNPLEITKPRIKIAILAELGIANVPEVTFPGQHLLANVDAVSLEIHLLEQQSIDLLELHLVPIVCLFKLALDLLQVSLYLGLVLVDRFPERGENIELVLVYERH